jgi:hypothetical protein
MRAYLNAYMSDSCMPEDMYTLPSLMFWPPPEEHPEVHPEATQTTRDEAITSTISTNVRQAAPHLLQQ